MKHITEHCDLCGISIDANRSNGWVGHMRIEGCGNFCVSDKSKELSVCKDCGNSILEHIESLRKNFDVQSNVTIEKP